MRTSQRNSFFLVAIVFTTLFFLAILTVIGIVIFNEKTIVVPDEEGTISGAVAIAEPGDIILVKAKEDGNPYEENVSISTENIKLVGIGKTQPFVMGDEANAITVLDTTGVLVKNFRVQAVGGSGDSGISLNNANHNLIKGNTSNDNDDFGITVFDSDFNIIKENILNQNAFGMNITNDSDSNLVKRNVLNDNSDLGISLSASSNENSVFFNIAFGNTFDDIQDADDNNFKGNECDNSDPGGLCN
ncbi:right-handed parallel beta-helix repeat-containing protein [Bacillus spongiae]|uniref:Right-handed parallel beta-helix repeat-containing protein n=1 Tax=Bacillus spongiae TaxID=2683610 RepID=A0ABU8HAQ7_9BACI